MNTLTFSSTLQPVNCANCGILFAFPQTIHRERRSDHKTFYCPSGHNNYFPGKSEEEKLRDVIAEKERSRDFWSKRVTELSCEKASLRHQLHGTKGALVKVRKRIQHGVCPCCNRTFIDLARHMATKHPTKNA